MSSGHDINNSYASSTEVDRVMANEAVQTALRRFTKEDSSHDLPYLAGYSEDGTTIYFDRHLPEELEAEQDGITYLFRPREFIRLHEEMEKALIDVLGWVYLYAHRAGNAVERRAVLKAGIPWGAYDRALKPFIKSDEHEKLTNVPKDLDLTPYRAPPVDKALLERMERAMGDAKLDQKDPTVEYSDTRGRPDHHCGPDAGWPRGFCDMYRKPYSCTAVSGFIDPRGGCNLWERAEESEEKEDAKEQV